MVAAARRRETSRRAKPAAGFDVVISRLDVGRYAGGNPNRPRGFR
jgi:hypothetical protein